MIVPVTVPTGCAFVEWLVEEGHQVEAFEVVALVEDLVGPLEICAPKAGVLARSARPDDFFERDAVIGWISPDGVHEPVSLLPMPRSDVGLLPVVELEMPPAPVPVSAVLEDVLGVDLPAPAEKPVKFTVYATPRQIEMFRSLPALLRDRGYPCTQTDLSLLAIEILLSFGLDELPELVDAGRVVCPRQWGGSRPGAGRSVAA